MDNRKKISWQEAEKRAKSILKRRYKTEFDKDDRKVGPKEREFDLVSSDKKVVAQVKLCTKLSKAGRDTRFKRDFLYDCLLLDKVSAKKKIFFLAADKEIFDDFAKWKEGLISEAVKMLPMDPHTGNVSWPIKT